MTQAELPIDEEHEREIVHCVLQGDVQAFEALVLRYQKPLYNLALRATGNEDAAADLTQEAFTRAYAQLERFDRKKRFFPWLYTIAVNVVRDHLRKKGRERVMGVEDPEGMAARAWSGDRDAMQDHMELKRLVREMENLPLDYREALVLRFRQDFSMKEIAQALGIGLSGAKMRVSRGLQMLRKRLKEQ
ncbi:RNA polymerase sigma factor [Salidesulfovibrio onnuriiensis]|uniref:RNA polymerase sigma factor n=1 Tax=Salidesulfovibrio onnuriiensis TaxID=2583823 RepID=UPI00202B06AD|nr:sigma-70 family RNA polymerase sigma factor [Salidesulfovibrio onnuriiensis]